MVLRREGLLWRKLRLEKMKHWTAPSGGSSVPVKKLVFWLKLESTNITKNPACGGRKNLRRLESADITD